jgi:hypothetical protein
MSTTFDADAFALRTLRFDGRDYQFRPCTIKGQIDYLTPVILPKFTEADDTSERNKVLIEAIKHFIPDIDEDALMDTTLPQLWAIYRYTIDGTLPQESEKNS